MRRFGLPFGALLGALVVAFWTGCSQQSGVTTNGTEVSRGGCSVDLKEICEAFMSRSEFTVNQNKYDARSFEQNSPRHEDVILPYNYPDGTLLASVRCQFDTVHRKITSASLASGPPIDDKAMAYIQSQGFCTETFDEGGTTPAKQTSSTEQH